MILFISINDIKDLSILDENIDDKYLIPNILKAQSFIIKPLLGDYKYKEIEEQIKLNILSDDNRVLLEDYIQNVIIYYVISEVIVTTAFKLKNKGVDDSDKLKELLSLSKKYLNDSKQFEQILLNYMGSKNIKEDIEYKGYGCPLYLGKTINSKGYDNKCNK